MDFPNGTSIIEPPKIHKHHHHHHGGGGHKHGSNCKHEHNNNNNNNNNHHQSDGSSNASGIPFGARANPTSTDLFQAIEVGDLPLVHYIVTRLSGSVQIVDGLGNTGLHVCARRGYIAIAKYLVEQGAIVDAVNTSGHTPLMYSTTHGHIGMANVLLQLGADVNVQDNLGFNTIMHAAQYGNVFMMHYLLSNTKVNIDSVDKDGHTALCWAAYNGHDDLLEYMLGPHSPYVPHLGLLDNTKRTPLHWAAIKNFPKICSIIINSKCMKCESDTQEGDTLAREQCPTGKEMLAMRDVDGKTPSECASYKGHTDTAQDLEYERNGIRALSKPENSKQENKMLVLQFLSSFIPFHVLFWMPPYVPFYAVILFAIFMVWVHTSGLLNWSNRQKTMVPAGLLLGSLMAMFYCSLFLELSMLTVGLMLGSECMLYYVYYNLMFEDPGFIPPSESYVQKALEVAAHGIEPSSEYCRKCKIIKPARAKHCYYCKACSDRHDHHCYWIFNCVAYKNYRKFYTFLLQVLFQIIFFVALSVSYLWEKVNGVTEFYFTEGIPFVFREYPQISWMIVFFCSFFCPMFMLCTYHTTFIARDITTYEMISGNRSKAQGKPHKNAHAKKAFSIFRVVRFLRNGTSALDNDQSSGGKDYALLSV